MERERKAEAERERKVVLERERQAEEERKRQAALERERKAEAARQAELERERKAELARQAEEERKRQTALERERKAGKVVSLPGGVEMAFVWIPAGEFQMGSPSEESGRDSDEGPLHEVKISKGFYLGTYEVTQGQWSSVMGSRPWEGEAYVRSNSSHPAVYISWGDVHEFIGRLNDAAGDSLYRLPSEAEWEYACRGGDFDPLVFWGQRASAKTPCVVSYECLGFR